MLFSPSPLRQSQIDEWLRSFSPVHSLDMPSPDMFSPSTPGANALNAVGGVVFPPPSSPRQSQIDEWLRSLSPISPSMLNIVGPQELPEFDVLIFGRLLNTTQPIQEVTDWAEDGYNFILSIHALAI
ncbi:uncharacterized protein LOC115033359 [Acyrthosiphon pisum]|uniref:Uncharacterized protein n=1 Tax=Acyrthosiphon pisum TaxID=7029 RepID=A0A8R2NK36_ACYPI|nr:uncharacterized protein LOC115033359 [Acyrthosiphon pisum]